MGNCESADGNSISAGGQNDCWKKGGVKWKSMFSEPVMNPNLPAAFSYLKPQSPDAAKAVDDAKKATAVAAVATAAAGKAEQTAIVAQQNAEVAKAAAEDAKTVRDKCIKAADEAHQTAIKACGPELGAVKEGFGDYRMNGLWLLLLVIILVFVAICMQGVDTGVTGVAGTFEIDSALV